MLILKSVEKFTVSFFPFLFFQENNLGFGRPFMRNRNSCVGREQFVYALQKLILKEKLREALPSSSCMMAALVPCGPPVRASRTGLPCGPPVRANVRVV